MSKLTPGAMVALSLAALAGPALAGPSETAFENFRAVCGATAAEFPAVVTAADGSGWKNTQIVTDTMPGVSITDKQARHKPVAGDTLALFVTRGLAHTKTGDIGVSTCTVSSGKADFAALVSLTQQWLGMPAHDTTATKVGFHYTPNGAAAAAVPDGGLDAAAGGAGMMLMSVKTGGGQTTLDLVKLKK